MTTALYRRYRPETFADVIGQEHVTEPLMQALRTGRVNHAYLFSGPRGCGKTTSARILARCLNCEQGPTPTPCGTCESCVALARGGPGSVDVIEIDAASHGGVDDARDLRERASFGPASSRYKIYIIDEAHMVTPQGFNALLKIVEEPPEHVKFVFATTEPEKVIGTIRSRTHHYPFRLVPPQKLTDYMEKLLDAEGVACEPGVLSFVTRAGGGSVRDSLSVLDQLIAGSGPEGLTYTGASSLLGFTDDELLDGIIEAFSAGDSAAVFRQIDRVVESGADPRRFVEDLLERLRDLIVVAAVAEGAGAVLRSVPEDQLARMRGQAASFGPGALSRAADVINAGLTEMTGATSPRLQLELMCARVLLPGIAGLDGYAARLDRMERRLDMGELPPRAAAGPVPHAPSAQNEPADGPGDLGNAGAAGGPWGRGEETRGDARAAVASGADGGERPRWQSPSAEPTDAQRSADVARPGAPGSSQPGQWQDDADGHGASPRPESAEGASASHSSGEAQDQQQRGSAAARDDARAQQPVGISGGADEHERERVQQEFVREQRSDAAAGEWGRSAPQEAASSPSQGHPGASGAPAATEARPVAGGMSTDDIRRAWPDVLDRIFRIKRVTWTLLSQNAQVMSFDGRRLVLGASSAGLASTMGRGQHMEVVRQALVEAIGVDVPVEARPMEGGSGQDVSGGAPQSPPRGGGFGDARGQQGQQGQQGFAPSGAAARSGFSAAPASAEWGDEPAPSDAPPDEMAEFMAPSASRRGFGQGQEPPHDGAPDAPTSPSRGAVTAADRVGPGSAPRTTAASGGQNAWGDVTPSAAQNGHSGQGNQANQGNQGNQGGWRARTGWGQQPGQHAPVDPARAGDPAAHEAPREAATPAQDAGLAAAAAQSSAWGSDSRGDWSAQSGPAPAWADGPAGQGTTAATAGSAADVSAPGSAQTSESTPDWMEDEPETDVEAVYDPLPPKSGLGAGSGAQTSTVNAANGERAGDGQAAAARDDAAAGSVPAAPQPTQGDVDDGRHLTPRQRAEKAAREAAQRDEDARRGGRGSRFDDASASVDDEDIENSDAVGLPVIKSVLGGTVIKEEGPDAGA